KSAKLAWRTTTFRPKDRSRSSARRTASASRSSPISRPAGAMRRSRASPCPPSPIVASTITAPGRGARYVSTSSTRTGRCTGVGVSPDSAVGLIHRTATGPPHPLSLLQEDRLVEMLGQRFGCLDDLPEPRPPERRAPHLQPDAHPHG